MLTKMERFEQWRGKDKELDVINTAILMGHYLKSNKSLEQINADFNSIDSKVYNLLNQYNKCSTGSLVYCILTIKETLDLIPETAIKEKELLSELKDVLVAVYEYPLKNVLNNIKTSKECLTRYLNMNIEDIFDTTQAHMLCFAFYSMLQICSRSLQEIKGWKRTFISTFVDINQQKTEVNLLLKLADGKLRELDDLVGRPSCEKKGPMMQQSIQAYFNKRYLPLFRVAQSEDKVLHLFEQELDKVTIGLNSLVAAKMKKKEICFKISQIQALGRAAEENEKHIRGRKYFLDFIQDHQAPFSVLMTEIQGNAKAQLEENIEILNTPYMHQHISANILYIMSWTTSLMSVVYRSVVNPSIQDVITNKLPSTRDSECKELLRELVQESLMQLGKQLNEIDEELDNLNQNLSMTNEELRKRVEQESYDTLHLLLKANNATKEALCEYRRMLAYLREKRSFLRTIKNTDIILEHFIQKNDNWLVKLSNFMSHFSIVFKTEMALMIDSAYDLQKKLKAFETKYKSDVTVDLIAIAENPDLPEDIKLKFKKEFEDTESNILVPKENEVVNQLEMRDLLYNSTLFFNTKLKQINNFLPPQASCSYSLVAQEL